MRQALHLFIIGWIGIMSVIVSSSVLLLSSLIFQWCDVQDLGLNSLRSSSVMVGN